MITKIISEEKVIDVTSMEEAETLFLENAIGIIFIADKYTNSKAEMEMLFYFNKMFITRNVTNNGEGEEYTSFKKVMEDMDAVGYTGYTYEDNNELIEIMTERG